MPTNEERRIIAKDIRDNYACDGLGVKIVTPHNIALAIGMCPGPLIRDVDFWYRLAALIEPDDVRGTRRACHVVPMDAAGNPPYRKGDLILNEMSDGCSECGYPFDTANRGVPNFCENCGAKVMSDAD